MPDYFPCLLRIQAVLFKTKGNNQILQIQASWWEQKHVMSHLPIFCMDKRVAEIFQAIELEQILAVCLLLYFSKNISYLSLVKEPLLHGPSGHILYPQVLRAWLFRGRVSQKSVFHWRLRLGWYKDSALGSSTGAMSFASKEPMGRKSD